MVAQILDGNAIAKNIHDTVALGVKSRIKQGLRAPGLAVIIIGENPASRIYVSKKRQICEALGIISKPYDLPTNTSEEVLLELIEQLNNDTTIDGILVQLPLPSHINTNKVLEKIRPDKDVDGFHPCNIGYLAIGYPKLRSCAPKGIVSLLKHINLPLLGLNATIIGASNIVGKPMALELLMLNVTVSICHAATKDIAPFIRGADIVIAAAGVPHLVKGEWIKEGAIVIDVGINRLATGKIVGDVEFEIAKERASWITPVPGGVGPLTVAMLMENTLYAANELHI